MTGPMHNANADKTITVYGDDAALGTSRRAGRILLIVGLALLVLAGGIALLIEISTLNTTRDCALIDDADLRLSCYDSSIHRSAPPPARGALAPTRD